MNTKTILAFIVIALILLLYPLYMQFLTGGKKSGAPVETSVDSLTAAASDTSRSAGKSQAASTLAVEKSSSKSASPSFVPAQTGPEEVVKVETPLYSAIFSSRGGDLKSFILKKYKDHKGAAIDLVQNGEGANNLEILFSDSSFSLSSLNFKPDLKNLTLSEHSREGVVNFSYGSEGLKFRKSYTFHPDRYAFDLSLEVEAPPALLGRKYYLAWNSGLPATEEKLSEELTYFAAYANLGGEVLENKISKGSDLQHFNRSGKTVWTSTRSKYFVAALISPDSSATGFQAMGQNLFAQPGGQGEEIGKKLAVRLEEEVPGQNHFAQTFQIYIGPLDYWKLREYKQDLEKMSNLGWKIIRPVTIGIMWFLGKLYSVIPNYGVVIILFTVVMKIIFFPLSRKMTKTSLAMSEMAPKINKLKEKFKEDKQRLNQEIFKLYKEQKVNPLGGCLPLLVQIPIFWAFFILLRSTIELRQAPFAGWITDLSLMDPYYILPILMALSMFVQQKMTIKDPRQKLMAYLMPGLFFFFFMSFPAGLTLYWTIYNLLSVAEQLIVRRQMQSPTQPAVVTS
ncbi:MAG: membrane protein insertase YidC [candidate division Zixibacteria bacterium]|nr:membrane protein insertase YidC [candidate division Zixibacteria bacterium]